MSISNGEKILFCTECGTELRKKRVGAEKMHDFEGNYCAKFDRDTGKRQYVWEFRCKKEKWYNRHSRFYEECEKLARSRG